MRRTGTDADFPGMLIRVYFFTIIFLRRLKEDRDYIVPSIKIYVTRMAKGSMNEEKFVSK